MKYFFENGLEMVDHIVGRKAFGIARRLKDALELTKDAPLFFVLEVATMRVLMALQNTSKRWCVQYALKRSIEEASIAEVV